MEGHSSGSQAVVGDLEIAGAISFEIREVMNQAFSSVDDGFDRRSLGIAGLKFPNQLLGIALVLAQVAENKLLLVVPKGRAAKYKTERHFVSERFQSRGAAVSSGKMHVRPSPKIAVPVTAIVALHAIAERLAAKRLAVERNFAGEDGIGMRRAREADPAFATEFGAKRRAIAQIPGDAMAVHIKFSATLVFGDTICARFKRKRTAATRAEAKFLQGETLNPGFRFSQTGKPGGPDLHRLSARFLAAPATPRASQQIAQPPRAAAIGETEPQEPHFVPPPHGKLGKRFVECLHGERKNHNRVRIEARLGKRRNTAEAWAARKASS